ncbi:hypothetical protein [Actinomadura sp. 1N219]|uniref:hypothetical protein n=1 Tax=Actinomadura sp. 1N219 TaxID=3375152 RepID=UPI0037C1169A
MSGWAAPVSLRVDGTASATSAPATVRAAATMTAACIPVDEGVGGVTRTGRSDRHQHGKPDRAADLL